MDYDLIILGAGPSGMTAGVYAARKMMKTLVVSKDVGGQMLWTKDVENYMGYRYITAAELLKKFDEQLEQFSHLELGVGDPAERVDVIEGGFNVKTRQGIDYTATTIIVATGKTPRRLNVPGEEKLTGRGVAYCSTCDAPLFKSKNVAVAGGGNSAIEAVIELSEIAKTVTAINISRDWQADPILMDKVSEKQNLALVTEHRITEILGDDRVTGLKMTPTNGGESKTIPLDGLFVEIGLIPNGEPVKHLMSLTPEGEIPVDCACKTQVPGIFAAGDVTTVPEKQIIVAAGEGAKAALSAYKYWARQK